MSQMDDAARCTDTTADGRTDVRRALVPGYLCQFLLQTINLATKRALG